VGSANFMRLSLKKGAHAAMSRAAYRKFGIAQRLDGAVFRNPSMQAGPAVYIAIVGMVYRLLLRQLWNPQGAQWVADVLLHDVIPVGYVLYWLLFAPRAGLRWRDALDWLLYPAVYLVYILARGAVSRVYPYPVVDVNVLGYGGVLVRAAMFLLVFLGMGLIVVTVGRRIRERPWRGRAALRV
jgi:hypothetical protein